MTMAIPNKENHIKADCSFREPTIQYSSAMENLLNLVKQMRGLYPDKRKALRVGLGRKYYNELNQWCHRNCNCNLRRFLSSQNIGKFKIVVNVS